MRRFLVWYLTGRGIDSARAFISFGIQGSKLIIVQSLPHRLRALYTKHLQRGKA